MEPEAATTEWVCNNTECKVLPLEIGKLESLNVGTVFDRR